MSCSTTGCRKPVYARKMCCAHYKRYLKARRPGTAQPRKAPTDGDPALATRASLPELLAALAAAVPPLTGARCRGRHELFDSTIRIRDDPQTPSERRAARAAAVAVCDACPALDPCRAWLDSLEPAQRPAGVIAGQVA